MARVGKFNIPVNNVVAAAQGDLLNCVQPTSGAAATWSGLLAGTDGQKLQAKWDSYTKLASSFDGANLATAYTDPIAGAYTFVSGAKLSTAQYKWTSSLLLNGSTDYVTLPDSDDWNFGTGDFTIDCWVYLNVIDLPTQTIASQQDVGGNTLWNVGIRLDNYLVLFFRDSSGVIQAYYVATQTALTTGQWYHVAFERTTTTGKIFLNGVSQTLAVVMAFGTNTMPDVNSPLNIGSQTQAGVGNYYFNGYIDELRISKGIARFTADFKPPTGPYAPIPTWVT